MSRLRTPPPPYDVTPRPSPNLRRRHFEGLTAYPIHTNELDIHYIPNVLQATSATFILFCARNPLLCPFIHVISHIPEPINKIIFYLVPQD